MAGLVVMMGPGEALVKGEEKPALDRGCPEMEAESRIGPISR